jgi:hypothetical protein
LYSHNTFIFLQNRTLQDLHETILEEQFESLRSVHFHWQFREDGYSQSRGSWNEDYLAMSLWLLESQVIPRLEQISTFFQGPLNLASTYIMVVSEVSLIRSSSAVPPKLFVLRLPYPMLLNNHLDVHNDSIDNLLVNPHLPFQVVRPKRISQGVSADVDVGVDVGWRYGTLFCPFEDDISKVIMKNCVVWTPLPEGVRWPCVL